MNFVLTPLRFLLASEADPSLLDLEDNYANRVDTLLYCVVQVIIMNLRETFSSPTLPCPCLPACLQVKVVRSLCAMLPEGRFAPEVVHRACGALETNCYELGWEGVRARALYRDIR